MEIEFISDFGSINFGGNGNFPFRLTAIDGMWLTGRNFNLVSYAGIPGQTATGMAESARTITISGDLLVDPVDLLTGALCALHSPGRLVFSMPNKIVQIFCRCSATDKGDRKGCYQKYVFQFICEDPYFQDIEDTVIPLYSVTGMLNDDFTFPGVFSTGIVGGSLYYTGTAPTEPVISIDLNTVPADYTAEQFVIQNESTGQKIGIDYVPSSGDVIILDIPERKIYLADGTDLLPNITDDTFLSGFTLNPGNNNISVVGFDQSTDTYIECVYKNKYLEAAF